VSYSNRNCDIGLRLKFQHHVRPQATERHLLEYLRYRVQDSDWSVVRYISLIQSFYKRVTRPCFGDDRNTAAHLDMLASLVISGAMTSTVDFSMVVGIKSTGDDFAGSERIGVETSSTVSFDRCSSEHASCRCILLSSSMIRRSSGKTPNVCPRFSQACR